jgi:hypothetical protein
MHSPRKAPSLFVPITGDALCTPFQVPNPVEATPWFARGFHEAAQELVKMVSGSYPDYAAVPIIFMYRHAMELALKGAIWDADEIATATGRTPSGAPGPQTCGHAITPLLPHFRHALKEYGWVWNENKHGSIEDAERLIRELDAVDSGSYTFRYPMKRDGSPSEQTDFVVNVVHFARLLDPVLEGILDFCFHLEDVRYDELSY